MQEYEPKVQGGAYTWGSIIAGLYGIHVYMQETLAAFNLAIAKVDHQTAKFSSYTVNTCTFLGRIYTPTA